MKKNVMPTVVLGSILVIVALLLSVVNMVTGPIIEANRNAAANGALLEVLPEGKGFEELNAMELGLPAAVTNVYKETSGKGFVFRVTSSGYKSGMVIMVGVDAEGKVAGSKCLETQDTFGKEPELDNSYNGQTMSEFNPNMISGATMTSNGYRDAVSLALQAYALASGGEIDPAIALEALIKELAPGFVNPAKIDATGSFKKVLKASNDAGFAYIMQDGEETFLVLVNATGGCTVYDAEKNDVTAMHESLVTEAKAHAAQNQVSYVEALSQKMKVFYGSEIELETLEIPTFNTVVAAVKVKTTDAEYYGFYSRSVGFHQMDVFFVIDESGAIAKMDARQFIFDEEYFMNFGGMDVSAYKDGFVGATADTWTDDKATIATATMTSNAVKQSTRDSFEAFNAIKEENNNEEQ